MNGPGQIQPHQAPPALPPSLPSAGGLAAALRHGTADLHELVEANPRFARLLAKDLRHREYVATLQRLLGFHAPMEAALRAWVPHLPPRFLAPRLCRTSLLNADLASLGLDAPAIAALPHAALPALPSPEAAWGVLYVNEGSSLGGQVIARNVASALGLGYGHGGSFHLPYGDQVGPMWRGFKAALEVASPDLAELLRWARWSFSALDAWVAEG